MRATQFVKTELAETSLQEIDRRGFLKGAGAAAASAAAGKAGAKGIWASIPVYTDSDPPLPRTVKLAWNYFSPDVLTQDDKNNIVKLINLLYFAKMAPEEWRDSQNGRIIGNATPSQIYKKCHELLIFINDAFVNLDFGKVMNDQKSKIENLYKNNPEQFKKLQEFFFSKWETIVLMGKLLEKRLTKKDQQTQQVEPDQEQQRRENLQRMQRRAGQGPSRTYAGQLVRHIKPNLTYTGEIDGNPRTELEIRQAPDGTILSRRIVQSSGNTEWDNAVLRAVDKTGSLPMDTDGYVPPVIVLGFRPNDINEGMSEGNYDRDDYYNARQGREYGRDMTATGWGGDNSATRRADIFKGQSKRLPADPFARTSGAVPTAGTGRIHSNALPGEMDEANDQKIGGRYDADDFDDMVARLKKLAGAGPMRTVYDPDRRVYRNMPTAVQPAQQPKKAPR